MIEEKIRQEAYWDPFYKNATPMESLYGYKPTLCEAVAMLLDSRGMWDVVDGVRSEINGGQWILIVGKP